MPGFDVSQPEGDTEDVRGIANGGTVSHAPRCRLPRGDRIEARVHVMRVGVFPWLFVSALIAAPRAASDVAVPALIDDRLVIVACPAWCGEFERALAQPKCSPGISIVTWTRARSDPAWRSTRGDGG